MSFDGIFLHLTLQEIKQNLLGCRVDKIYQPSRDELLFAERRKEPSGCSSLQRRMRHGFS